MKKSVMFVTLLCLGLAGTAQAGSSWSVKAGQLSVDGDDSAALQGGIVYQTDIAGMFGLEFEANTSITDGEFQTFLGAADYSVTQLGGFAVVMSPGPIYFKGKAGMTYNDIDIGGASDSDTDVAYGVGVGFFGFEVEYTRTKFQESDVDFISVSFGF